MALCPSRIMLSTCGRALSLLFPSPLSLTVVGIGLDFMPPLLERWPYWRGGLTGEVAGELV